MDFFTCIFQGFQYLIDLALCYKNQANRTNKSQSTFKKYIRKTSGKFGYIYIYIYIYNEVFAYP